MTYLLKNARLLDAEHDHRTAGHFDRRRDHHRPLATHWQRDRSSILQATRFCPGLSTPMCTWPWMIRPLRRTPCMRGL